MRLVFRTMHLSDALLVRTQLELQGIASVLRNEHVAGSLMLHTAAGVTPEVWILDDKDLDRAMSIVGDTAAGLGTAAERDGDAVSRTARRTLIAIWIAVLAFIGLMLWSMAS